MAYADDLLQLARDITSLHPNEAHQPSLRRALSTAYYALFHLLISDAVASCSDPKLRASLSRMFDHGPLRQASDNKVAKLNDFFKQRPPKGPEYDFNERLYSVAETFSEALIIGTKPITIRSENGSRPKRRCSSKEWRTRSIAGTLFAERKQLGTTSSPCFPAETRNSPKEPGGLA